MLGVGASKTTLTNVDGQFERLFSAHVLEHASRPLEALQMAARFVRHRRTLRRLCAKRFAGTPPGRKGVRRRWGMYHPVLLGRSVSATRPSATLLSCWPATSSNRCGNGTAGRQWFLKLLGPELLGGPRACTMNVAEAILAGGQADAPAVCYGRQVLSLRRAPRRGLRLGRGCCVGAARGEPRRAAGRERPLLRRRLPGHHPRRPLRRPLPGRLQRGGVRPDRRLDRHEAAARLGPLPRPRPALGASDWAWKSSSSRPSRRAPIPRRSRPPKSIPAPTWPPSCGPPAPPARPKGSWSPTTTSS